MPLPTTLERLRVLTAVATNGTIAGAARSLGYTASAVSQHLSSLEREASVPLVERSNRGVTLTPAGRLLAERSGAILDQVRTAFDDVAAHGDSYETTLTIAAFPTAITNILLPIRQLLSPAIRMSIVDAESDESLRLLEAREIDGAITDSSARLLRPEVKTLVHVPLRNEPVRLIARRIDNLDISPGLAALQDAEWVLSGSHTSIGQAVRQLCHAAGFVPQVILETDDHRTTFDAVLAVGAVSVLPELALANPPAGLEVFEELVVPYERSIEFTMRSSLQANSALAELALLLAGADVSS